MLHKFLKFPWKIKIMYILIFKPSIFYFFSSLKKYLPLCSGALYAPQVHATAQVQGSSWLYMTNNKNKNKKCFLLCRRTQRKLHFFGFAAPFIDYSHLLTVSTYVWLVWLYHFLRQFWLIFIFFFLKIYINIKLKIQNTF